MPLALVLHATFGTWQRDVTKLNDWNQLVELEQTLLGRAQGAFLARWFGTSLPMFTGYVRVAIANLDALSAQYRELRRQVRRGASDLNLTEPLAGIAGTMVGALLAPTSSMALLAVIAKQMPSWLTTLAAALNWLTFGALGLLLFTIGVPVAALGLPLGAIAYRDQLAVVHEFLGVLAGLFAAARRFLEQLVGPRAEVRNPLLAKVLDVLDSVATLVPFVFALAVFIITWVGPRLSSLARQLDILIPLAADVFRIIGAILADLFESLQELYVGPRSPWGIVQGIIWTFRQWFRTMKTQFAALYATVAPVFEKLPVISSEDGKTTMKKEARAWLAVRLALEEAFDKAWPFIKQMTSESWLVKRIKEIAERFAKIVDILGHVVKRPAKKESSWIKDKFIGKFMAAVPPWPQDLTAPQKPVIPDFPSVGEIFAREEWLAQQRWVQPSILEAFTKPEPPGGYVFVLGPETDKALQRLRRPPLDVFAAERKTVLAGKQPEALLGEAQATEERLRTMLFAVIDHLLPAAVADEVPKLQGLLWKLDDFLYGKEATFPVRDLPGGDRLSLQVGQVRVYAPGMKDGVVRAWGKDMKTALENQVYRTDRAGSASVSK